MHSSFWLTHKVRCHESLTFRHAPTILVCGLAIINFDRDSWREEAQAHASEAKNLQETVNALRKYSEDEMIDALLGQVRGGGGRGLAFTRILGISTWPPRDVIRTVC